MNVENEFIKTWLDIAPEYLNFCLRFPRNPKMALSPYCGKNSISRDLTLFLLASVVVSYLLVLILLPVSLKDKVIENIFGSIGKCFATVSNRDVRLLPIYTLFLVFPFSIIIHYSSKVGAFIFRMFDRLMDFSFEKKDKKRVKKAYKTRGNMKYLYVIWRMLDNGSEYFKKGLTGTIEDTINATFSFFSFFIPFITLIFIGIWFAVELLKITITGCGVLIIALLFAGAFYIYLSLSLAATHTGMKARNGFAGVSLAILIIVIIVMLISNFINI